MPTGINKVIFIPSVRLFRRIDRKSKSIGSSIESIVFINILIILFPTEIFLISLTQTFEEGIT